MWTQIVGKIRLKQSPFENQWWNVPFYVAPRGLTTSAMPYNEQLFQITFDFIDHMLIIETTDGSTRKFGLQPRSVAEFYKEMMTALESLKMPVTIWTTPVEVPEPIPFEEDHKHAPYDPEYAQRCWRILVQASRVLTKFRSRFTGKVSPVHFFWGAFDMAVTRFSGRPAPLHPGVPNCGLFVMQEAYSHEVSSCDFWPGGGQVDEPAFYAYAYPEPKGFKDYPIQPSEAFYHKDISEFLLPYEVVRSSNSHDQVLLDFLQSTIRGSSRRAPIGIGVHWNVNR